MAAVKRAPARKPAEAEGNGLPTAVSFSALTAETVPFHSDLQRVDVQALMAFRVTDHNSMIEAQQHGRACADVVKIISDNLDPICAEANRVHKALTGLRGKLMGPFENARAYLGRQCVAYEDRIRREEEERQRREQARLEEERRRRQAEIDERARVAEAEAAAASLFFDGEGEPGINLLPVVVEPLIEEPVVVVTPRVEVPWLSGNSSRNKPYDWEPDSEAGGLETLILACAEKLRAGDRSLIPYLQFNEREIKAKAREVGDLLATVVPGVKAKRDRTMAMR